MLIFIAFLVVLFGGAALVNHGGRLRSDASNALCAELAMPAISPVEQLVV